MNGIFSIALDASVRAILESCCVAAILTAARVRSATARHAAWTAVMAAMLFMPVLPKLALPISLPAATEAISQPAAPRLDLSAPMPAPPTAQTSQLPAATGRPPAPAPAGPPAPRSLPWPWFILGVYLTGSVTLLARLAIGWRGAYSLVRAARPVCVPSGGIPVHESAAVAAPLTTGVFRPRIVLPHIWRDWPAEKLRAVLAHEAAHVRRRDGMIALFTQVNRCLFWFHPLAWWLEREILTTSEQAADEAAIGSTAAPRVYAQILIDMAGEVRRRGGLHAAQSLSMAGGALERRIDSILSAHPVAPMSRRRKAAVALGCAISIFLFAACHQKSRSDAALVAQVEARDRFAAESDARRKAARQFEAAARSMTNDQAAALESGLQTNPDDLNARRKLLAYYGGKMAAAVKIEPHKPHVIDYAAGKAALTKGLPHYFWLIEHHPEDALASSDGVLFTSSGIIGVFPSAFDPQPDPQNLERARKIWLEQADRDNRPGAVYLHAFQFFRHIDKPVAEKMLLRVQAADPKGEFLPYTPNDSWTARLGTFYAELLTARRSAQPTNPVSAFMHEAYGPLDPGSPYAAELRHKLETSSDPTVLLSAASRLVGMAGAPPADLDFADVLIKRASTLQPGSAWARQLLNMAADQRTTASLPAPVWQGSLESRHQAIEQLAAGDRFRELTNLAISAGDEGVRIRAIVHDEAGAKAAWQHAGRYATEALKLADEARNHPDYGTAFFNANMILGMAAIAAGDAKSASSYLLKAADAPVTDALRDPIPNARPWRMNWTFPSTLEAALLKAGERDAVVAFLERYSQMTVSDRDRCLEDLALMREGKAPSFFRNPI
jgi:beta-lactamase regulating signal transducer with metallopeptidase domain